MIRKSVVSGQWSVVSECGKSRAARLRRPSGITLTEILIAIMILGIGLVSLATLFPIGLVRLRDATRYTRSATLLQTAASDAAARGMFAYSTFTYADNLNGLLSSNAPPYWYVTPNAGRFDPFTQDTPFYGGDWATLSQNGSLVYLGANVSPYVLSPSFDPSNYPNFASRVSNAASNPGLPFAYDPLWRYYVPSVNQTYGLQGYYSSSMGPTFDEAYEARFGYGLTTVRGDSFGDPNNGAPSAHGLQRITNFNRAYVPTQNGLIPLMPSSQFVPNAFVSQEDMVLQDPDSNRYTINGAGGTSVTGPSPVLPDLSPPLGSTVGGNVSLDWRYSWMYTGNLNSAANLACFDGNIVIFENRPFGIGPSTGPFAPPGAFSSQNYQVEGETVVEAVFGYSNLVIPPGGPQANGTNGYGSAADRTVLLRWPAGMPDPVVRPGDWIADVTYERQQQVVLNRFLGWASQNPTYNQNFPFGGLQNWANKLECDNLPAQRCIWYQVQKVSTPAPATAFTNDPAAYRSMVVLVNQNLISRTILSGGQPVYVNAALIAPNVVNVIPLTVFLRSGSGTGPGNGSGTGQ